MKIQNKLFLIFCTFSLVLVAIMVLLIQWSMAKGMVDYVNNKEFSVLSPLFPELTSLYEMQGGWQSIEGQHRRFQRMLSKHLRGTEFQRPPKPEPRGRHNRPRRNEQGSDRFDPRSKRGEERVKHRPKPPKEPPVSYALLDSNKRLVVGDYSDAREFYYQKLENKGELVGYFAISKRHQLIEGYELEFIAEQKMFLWVIALVTMLMVLVVTLPLARHFTRPIKLFMEGMHKLTHGDYQQKLSISRKDEFAELARDYNELAKTLAENEHARRRWLANISHELRTPVAILRGELEAILDGIRRLSLEQVNSAHAEVLHLERLITDLHALTSADIGGMSYRKETVDLSEFLQSETDKFTGFLRDGNLTLTAEVEEKPTWVYADTTRLCQLLENLIANCVKYASGGSHVLLTMCIDEKSNEAVVIVEDDGQGVEDEHLPHLFEHLYRVESSRNRKMGGTGLGLSICSHIVSAHNGRILAEKSKLGGLAIIIKFPLVKR